MTRPTPQRIEVALAAMRDESALWTDLSHRLHDIVTTVTSMSMRGTGATFVFDEFIRTHELAVRAYTRLCADGSDQTAAVGLTLGEVAEIYAAEEAANLHAQYRLY
jgi:hypothetical protein